MSSEDLSALLAEAFPFHLEVGEGLRLLSWGASAPRLEHELEVGQPLERWFSLERPSSLTGDLDALTRRRDALFILRHKRTDSLLRGQLFQAPSDGRVFLLVSPWATQMADLEAIGLDIGDFGLQDPLVDMLYVIATRDASLADARRLAAEVETRRLEADRANDELRALADELKSANHELESYSYSISHDLQSPLRAIYGFAQILEMEYGERLPDEAGEYLGMVRQNVERMQELVTDLLRFSRASAQKPVLERVDVANLAREVVDELREGEQVPANAEVVIESLDEATADPILLRQVLANLIGNAVKYSRTQAAPRVVVGQEREGADAVYFVSDNGVGFDPTLASRLFEVFQRLHADSDFEGTGIGLAIAQRIVRAHGGRIWAEAAEGEGATFRFTLSGAHTR